MRAGDVAVYRMNGEVSHVGVVLRIEPDVAAASWRVTIMSQWGADGEYTHSIEDVPVLLGVPSEYWTDRRPIRDS